MSQPLDRQSAVSTRYGRIAFMLGGSLLIASSVLSIVRAAVPLDELSFHVQDLVYYIPAVLGAALFGASLLIFAWGIRGKGSVVAHKPIGLISLTALGLWNLVLIVIAPPLLAANPGENLVSILIIIGLPLLLPIVVITAVVSIGRAGAIPGFWRWAPVIAICPYLVLYVVSILSNTDAFILIMDFPFEAFVWADIGAQLLLGVLAIGLAVAAGRRAETTSEPLSPNPSAINSAEPAEPAV